MMKRREALKNIGLTTGFIVATPSLMTLLNSCTTEKNLWQPTFLSTDEGILLRRVTDIILPKTDNTPSATEVNVPEFIDKYMDQVLTEEEQQRQRNVLSKMTGMLKKEYNEDLDEISDEDYKKVLDKYLLSKGDKDPQRDANPNDSDFMSDYEFFGGIKYMTINAYRNSEKVGEEILYYDPVPAQYYCGNLQELTGGKANSL